MSNEYKQTLARFEAAVRADEFKGAQRPECHPAIEQEYDEAKRALIRKLQYRQLAADVRANSRDC